MTDLLMKTRHFRRYYAPSALPPFYEIKMAPMSEIRRNKIDRKMLIANGGKTEIAIYKNGEKVAEAESICSKHDNYCRKTGRLEALKKLGVQV